MAYAGDVTCEACWEILSTNGQAQLIDVRSRAEWVFVGIPLIAPLGRDPIFLEWQRYPEMSIEPDFAGELEQALQERNVPADAPLLFLCRSGVRSRSAAIKATEIGYARALNVSGGFEGDCDDQGHRGTVGGWKHAGLPWVQR